MSKYTSHQLGLVNQTLIVAALNRMGYSPEVYEGINVIVVPKYESTKRGIKAGVVLHWNGAEYQVSMANADLTFGEEYLGYGVGEDFLSRLQALYKIKERQPKEEVAPALYPMFYTEFAAA